LVEQRKEHDHIRGRLAIGTLTLLALALAGLYGLLLLSKEPQQINEWMGGLSLVGSIASAAVAYYFGGRNR